MTPVRLLNILAIGARSLNCRRFCGGSIEPGAIRRRDFDGAFTGA